MPLTEDTCPACGDPVHEDSLGKRECTGCGLRLKDPALPAPERKLRVAH